MKVSLKSDPCRIHGATKTFSNFFLFLIFFFFFLQKSEIEEEVFLYREILYDSGRDVRIWIDINPNKNTILS